MQNPKITYSKIKDILSFIQYGLSIEMNEDKRGYKIYRMNEIEDMFCSDDVSKFADISKEEMKKFKLKNNDVLFNRTNSFEFVGRTGIFREYSDEDFIFASYLVRIRTNESVVLPEYLTVFLNCKFGIPEVKRRARISINQSNVSAQELQKIKLPIPNMEFQKNIRNTFNVAFDCLKKSKQLYGEAENILINELNAQKYNQKKELTFEGKFKESLGANRMDADYFQPKYKEITKKIESYDGGSDLLKNIVKVKDKNFSPEKGIMYRYIELSNIVGQGEISGFISDFGENLPSRARRKVQTGDVILSSIEGSLSSCALITNEYDGALCSTGFYVINSGKINPETLLLLFKTELLQNLLKKGCSGTILTAINKEELEKIKIPIIKKPIQDKIAEKIKEAHKLRTESRTRLAKTKEKVEEFIAG